MIRQTATANATNAGWLAEHGVELQRKYAGKWFAVHGGEVVGVGDTAVEADKMALRAVVSREHVLQAIDHVNDRI